MKKKTLPQNLVEWLQYRAKATQTRPLAHLGTPLHHPVSMQNIALAKPFSFSLPEGRHERAKIII